MAGETDPKLFYEECSSIDPPVDNQEACGTGAHASPLLPPPAAQYNPRPAPPSNSNESATKRECARVSIPNELPPTVATHTRSSSNGQARVIEKEGRLPELSSPLVDNDSGSPQEVREMDDRWRWPTYANPRKGETDPRPKDQK